jgi:hypothetical protein
MAKLCYELPEGMCGVTEIGLILEITDSNLTLRWLCVFNDWRIDEFPSVALCSAEGNTLRSMATLPVGGFLYL